MLRFHLPLIEPDVRISRIRLSDKTSRIRTRDAVSLITETDNAQLLVQIPAGEACISPIPYHVLATPPLPEPLENIEVHAAKGLSDRAQPKGKPGVRPTLVVRGVPND